LKILVRAAYGFHAKVSFVHHIVLQFVLQDV